MKKIAQISLISLTSFLIMACQSTPKLNETINATPAINEQKTENMQQFNINGKIGLVSPKQAGSAFYVWSQNGKSFEIELSGAMNVGQTNISYDGKQATITSDKGSLTADTPEELLQKATGWQAPISQLSHWIMGKSAPSDDGQTFDSQNRLATADNHGWQATFEYNKNETLPNRIIVKHADGYKVTLTINRLP